MTLGKPKVNAQRCGGIYWLLIVIDIVKHCEPTQRCALTLDFNAKFLVKFSLT